MTLSRECVVVNQPENGLTICFYHSGHAPFMFAESTRDLTYLSRQLAVLRADQLWRLACWTSPFGLSDAEARCVDAAAATATGGGERVVKNSTTQPRSLVFGWNTYGLHCIYKCIARVAGNLSTNHPSEYRDILQVCLSIYLPLYLSSHFSICTSLGRCECLFRSSGRRNSFV